MIDVTSILAVGIAGFILSLSPGPSMFYIMSRTMSFGRKAGVISALGLAFGGIIHVILATIGISAIIIKNDFLFLGVKYLGAFYLFYLGGKTLISIFKSHSEYSDVHNVCEPTISVPKLFFESAIVEVSNPKTIIFFLSFIPQFLTVDSENIAFQSFVLGSLVPLTALPMDFIIALGGGSLIKSLLKTEKSERALNIVSSLVLILLGLRVLIT